MQTILAFSYIKGNIFDGVVSVHLARYGHVLYFSERCARFDGFLLTEKLTFLPTIMRESSSLEVFADVDGSDVFFLCGESYSGRQLP